MPAPGQPLLHLDMSPASLLAENQAFADWLKQQDSGDIDRQVQALEQRISPEIDCLACGNCCRSLMIVVEEAEANALSQHLNTSRSQFDERYLEKGSSGRMVMNQMPCSFLSGNACTVYDHRFSGCREFPALHLPQFTKRLFTTFMHYERCPIIREVVEALKKQSGFLLPHHDQD